VTEPVEPQPRSTTASRGRAVVLALGLVGLAVATKASLHDARDAQMPGPVPIVAALLLTRLALSCSARAWIALVGPGPDARLLRASLYESQLVKYLPAGGLLQATGQVAMTATQGIPLARVTLAYATLTVETVAAGLFVASGLVFVDGAPGWLRIVAPLGLLAPLVLHTRVLASVLGLVRRVSVRMPAADQLPSAAARARAFVACLGNQVLYAMGFVVLLEAVDPSAPTYGALVAYVIAWVAGFLVLPLPSGVGVREAVLVGVVPGVAAGPVLAASLAQRLVSIAAEVVAVLGNRVGSRRRHAGDG
jgi:uncharacterized membrane protein YbhN (UPF0104 family)